MYIGLIMTLTIGICCFMAGLWSMYKEAELEKLEEQAEKDLKELKERLKVADFMYQHGVIDKAQYADELNDIIKKADDIEEVLNNA